MVEQAAMANVLWTFSKGYFDSIKAVADFKAAGTEITELDQAAQDKLEELCIKFMELESARNPNYAKIAKSVVNFLKGVDTVKRLEGPFHSGNLLKRYPDIK